jgi:hypothetical protein
LASNLARITALASDGFSSLSLSFVGMTGPDLMALNTVGLRPVAAKVGMEFAYRCIARCAQRGPATVNER